MQNFSPLIFFFFHFRRRSRSSTRNNTPSSVESIRECICLFVYSFDVSSALRERESKREKNGRRRDMSSLVVGVKRHLRFSQKKSFWWILVKRAIYFSLSLLVFLFFCSSSLRAWCVSLRRGAFLKYDLTIVLLHYTLRRRGCASRLFVFLSDSSGIIITYYVGSSITQQ